MREARGRWAREATGLSERCLRGAGRLFLARRKGILDEVANLCEDVFTLFGRQLRDG